MVKCFMEIPSQLVVAVTEHLIYTDIKQLFLANSLVPWILKLILGHFLDYLPLIFCHRLEDESQTKLLIVILGREQIRLLLSFICIVTKSVHLDADKAKLINQRVSEKDSRLNIVHRNDKSDQTQLGQLRQHVKPFRPLQHPHIYGMNEDDKRSCGANVVSLYVLIQYSFHELQLFFTTCELQFLWLQTLV